MKHLKYKCLLLLMAVLCSIAARGAVEIDGIYYDLRNYLNGQYVDYAYVTYQWNHKYAGDIVIPSTVTRNGKTYSVTGIGWLAFRDCTELTSVTMPNTITTIESDAFEGCTSLRKVVLPNKLETIPDDSFSGCTSLEEINLPASLKEIMYDAFENCSSLKNVTLPSGLEKIGNSAFKNCSSLESIYIPKGIGILYYDTFNGCTGLTSIVVDVANPKYDSRGNCNAIIETSTNKIVQGCNTTTIPNDIKSIDSRAFQNMKSLKTIRIPSGLEILYAGTFSGCSGLTSIVVEGNPKYDSRNNCNAIIETEKNELILGCKNTKIPNDVVSIGMYAFTDCSEMTTLNLPASLTNIGNYAFSNCTGLKSVSFPNNLKNIGNYAFAGCTGIDEIVFPNSLETVNSNAFSGCSGLKVINFSQCKLTISVNAFADCTGLTSITIPSSITSILDGAFAGCYNLKSIIVEEGNVNYHSPNNCNAIIEKSTNKIIAGCNATKIPSDIKAIGNSAFQGCDSIKVLQIPNGVTSIGYNAFSECKELISVDLPNGIITIGSGAFGKCDKLQQIVYPPSIKFLGGFPVDCPNLKDIYLYAEAIPYYSAEWSISIIDDVSSYMTVSNATLHVLPSVIDQYLEYVWEEEVKSRIIPIIPETPDDGYLTYYYDRNNHKATVIGYLEEAEKLPYLEIPETVTKGEESFTVTAINYSGYPEMTAVSIPSTVTEIASSAFTKCEQLEKVIVPDLSAWCKIPFGSQGNPLTKAGHLYISEDTEVKDLIIPEGVPCIYSYAFQGCTGLTSVTIPGKVTTIGNSAFDGCSGLTSVEILEGVTSLGYNAFGNCTSLSSVKIPNSLTSISANAFQNCISLPVENGIRYAGNLLCEVVDKSYSYFTIKKGTRWIGSSSFQNCTNLTSITIPEGVAYIQTSAFRGCTYLESIILPRSAKEIANSFLYQCTNLQAIECKGDTAALSESSFWGVGSAGSPVRLLVPEKYLDNYQALVKDGMLARGYITLEGVEEHTLAYSYDFEKMTATVVGFEEGQDVEDVVIPERVTYDGMTFTVTTISKVAFRNTILSSVVLPGTITKINNNAFSNTQLSEITIPASVTNMGSSVFNGCTSLTDIYCYAKQVPSGGKGLVEDRKDEVTLHVPASALDDYKSNTYWGEIVNIVPMEEGPAEVKYNFVEYFIGTDPGLGYAKFVVVEPDENGAVEFDIPASELNFGLNTVGIRLVSYYDDGKPYYSPTTLHTVYRYHAEDAQTVGVEYFLNTDPGIGKAKCIIASSDSLSFDIPREQMKEGINVLGLRAISWNSETDYCYGATQYRYIYCPAANGNRDIERIEYFWDVDPGKGNGMAIDFYMVNDSAVVDCNIDYSGLSGTHILNIRALSHGVWSTLYQQAVVLVALTPLSGDLSLDPANVENVEQGRFSLLSSLLGALSTRGFTVGVNVNVADNTYNFIVSEESLLFIQKLYGLLVEKNFYLSMKAPKEAVFNFIMPEEFIYIHEKDIPQIVAAVQAMFSHILTENISILINGQVYQYDGFQVEPNDLMALKNMYNRLGGENWTEKKWSFKSNGRDKDELPGVTFSEEGRVREINLSNNGLVGELGSWELILPELRVLSLDRNQLTGDVAPFVSELTKLSSLDLCYNRLTEVSKPLPKNIGTLNLQSQFRIEDDVYGVYNLLEPFDSAVWEMKPIQAYISEKQTLSLPTILTYKHKEQNYSNSYGLYLYWHGIAETTSAWLQRYGESYEFKYTTNYDYAYPQDEQWLIAPSKGEAAHSAYPVKVHYMEGDANMSGYTDVLDVQHTLNYILSTVKKFNYSAANTYIDKQINVQDIVCTVNIVLDNELNTTASARSASAMPSEEPQGWLYTRNGQLQLMAAADVAAIDMELSGVKTSQVSLLLNHSQFQLIGRNTPTGSRYVIYSPTGQTIPAGEATALLKLSAQAEVVAAQAADIAAEEVRMALGEQPTGISQLMSSALKARFQGNSLVVTATTDVEHIALQLVTVGGATVYSTELPLLRRGETVFETAVAPGIYLLEMATKSGSRKMVKLMKK